MLSRHVFYPQRHEVAEEGDNGDEDDRMKEKKRNDYDKDSVMFSISVPLTVITLCNTG